MKKIIVAGLFLVLSNFCYSQNLSPAAIKDFSDNLVVAYKYSEPTDGTGYRYRVNVNMYKIYHYHESESAVKVEECVKNETARNQILKALFYSSDRDEETFFNVLYQLDISAEHANEIKDYYFKFVNSNTNY